MDLLNKILQLDSVYEGDGQQGGFQTNDPKEAIREVIQRAIGVPTAQVPITENMQLNLGPNVDEASIGGEFDVGGGQFTIGGGMRGDDKAFGIGFRKQFSDGSAPVPKYPDLRMFPATPTEAQAKAKAKVLNKFKNDLKKYLLKQIKDFKKGALPNEKYQLIENEVHRAMGYDQAAGNKPSKTVIKYVKEAISELPKDGSWELNKTGKGEIADSSKRMGAIPKDLKDRIKPFFRKNYKNLSVAQMAERLSGQLGGHPLHAAVRSALFRYRDFLAEKGVIKVSDVQRGMGGAEGVKRMPPKAYSDYKDKYITLAEKAGIADDPRFFATKGPRKDKFAYWKFDDYMKNTMLNMNKIRSVLGPNFPTMLLPSFEHIMGVNPGTITGDTSALKKVELQTKKYNFGAIDGMGARSADFRRVQNNLKSAVAELTDGNTVSANKSLAKVNQIYDNVAEKFNLNRNGLPNYTVKSGGIFENNLRQVSKAEKPNVSMFNFFEKVANQASEKEMKVIKDPTKVDPRVAKVITKIQAGDNRGMQKILASLSNNPACAVFAGKRGKFQPGGSPNANLDDCVKGGIDAINSGKVPKDKATDFVKILKGGGTAVRNIVKFGVLPEALLVTADSLIRVGMGDTFEEAGLRASEYILPGDQTKAADVSKVSRIFGDRTGEIVGKSIDYKNQINKINSLEAQRENLETTNVPSDFGYFDNTSSIKNIDSSIAQAKKDLDTKFFMPVEQRLFADRKFDEAYDLSMAKSGTIKKLGAVRETAEAMRDTEDFSALQSDAQAPTSLKLDTAMFPSFTDDMRAANISEEDVRRYFESIGQSPDNFLKIQENFKNLKKLPLSNLAQIYGDEQIYGTQGASALGEPLANGGIAGLSGGDKSGPPPERGPDSQGLRSLMKRGINL